MSDPVVTSQQIDGVLTLTLNRPQAANALSLEMAEALLGAIENAQDARLAVIRGDGRNFCAGFDLADVEQVSDGDLLWRFTRIETLLQAVHHAPFPTLALGQGHIIGAGADLFAACSYRLADPGAKLRFPGWNFELALGTRRLKRLIGKDAAQDILLDGRMVVADEAVRLGLATEIRSQDTWAEAIVALAKRASVMPVFSKGKMRDLTTIDSRAEDMAAVVASAGRPGLKDRIMAYQAAIAAEREQRRRA